MKSGGGIFSNQNGQVTIFIIIAVVVVAAGVLIYLFYPGIRSSQNEIENPQAFIESCIKDKIEETVEIISLQGGNYGENKNSYFYLGNNVSYLCYVNQYYAPCVVQQPLLVQHIESEIKKEIQGDAELCFENMVSVYNNEGYNAELTEGDFTVSLLPEKIVTNFNNVLVLSREDSERYDRFEVILNSNLYQIASISSNMVEWEQGYGEAPTSSYMDWYHNLKIERKQQLEGTNIYILTDRDYGDVFQFASRSYVLPPGY